MTTQSHRTPISFLQEICSKKGLTASYSVIYDAGPIHEPVYLVQCTVDKQTTVAKGPSKKKAKHMASYYMIMQLFQNNVVEESQSINLRSLQLGTIDVLGPNFMEGMESPNVSSYDHEGNSEAENNPVGQLQEYCAKNMWPPPSYEIENVKNNCGGNSYKCRINLWKWTMNADGPSKKQAKKKAASILLGKIIENNYTIPKEALESMEEESLPLLNDNDASRLKESKMKVSEVASKMASKALNGLWNQKNERIRPVSALLRPQDDPCEVLLSVADSLKIQLFYTYCRGCNPDETYCMIQLNTNPPQVFTSGPLNSMDAARKAAAQRAVLYLNSFSQKYIEMDYSDWFSEGQWMPPISNGAF